MPAWRRRSPPTPNTSRSGTRARSAVTRSAPCRSPDASPATRRTRRRPVDGHGDRACWCGRTDAITPCATRGSRASRSLRGPDLGLQALADHLHDLEGSEAVPAADRRRLAPADRVEEGVDLERERVALGDLAILEDQRRLPVVARLPAADAHPPLAVVDRQVGILLEDAQ